MKRFSLLMIALLLLATPLFAADRFVDLTGYAAWVDTNSEGTFNNGTDQFDVDFGSKVGYGAAVNIFFGDRISTELAVYRVTPAAALVARQRAVGTSEVDIEMIPITGVLQFHFAPNSFLDPYIGAGAAYITFGDVDQPSDLDDVFVGEVDSDNIGVVVNAGLSLAIGRHFALIGDVKYVPSGASAKGVLQDGTQTDIEINPIIASAGLSIRF